MKANIILCVFLLSLITSLSGQDHAPTVERCYADVRLWSSDYNASKDAASKLSLQALEQRSREMGDCMAVDPEGRNAYFTFEAAYITELYGRCKGFIDRHKLTAQFLAEDAAGKR